MDSEKKDQVSDWSIENLETSESVRFSAAWAETVEFVPTGNRNIKRVARIALTMSICSFKEDSLASEPWPRKPSAVLKQLEHPDGLDFHIPDPQILNPSPRLPPCGNRAHPPDGFRTRPQGKATAGGEDVHT